MYISRELELERRPRLEPWHCGVGQRHLSDSTKAQSSSQLPSLPPLPVSAWMKQALSASAPTLVLRGVTRAYSFHPAETSVTSRRESCPCQRTACQHSAALIGTQQAMRPESHVAALSPPAATCRTKHALHSRTSPQLPDTPEMSG